MKTLPKARTENLVEQNLKNETLIYDLLIDKAFNLNETSTIVYKACNGKTTFEELRRKHKFSDEFIFLALDELKRNDLLAKESVYVSPFAATNRREVIKKVGLASMFVLPIISGSIAPKAINAASNTDGGGNNYYNRGFLEACERGGPFCDRGNGYTCVNNTCCSLFSTGTLPPGTTYLGTGDPNVLFITSLPINGTCEGQSFCDPAPCCSGESALAGNCQTQALYNEDETEITACLIYPCDCVCQ